MHNAIEIANVFIGLNRGEIRPRGLHFLVYYAHGWTLAITHKPLIFDHVHASLHGVEYKSITEHIAAHGFNGRDGMLANPHTLEPHVATLMSAEVADIISHTWNKYRHVALTDITLIFLNNDHPWSRCRFNDGGRMLTIPDEMTQDYFTALGRAGQQVRQSQ